MENTDVERPWNQENEDDELEESLVTRKKNQNQTLFSTSINGDSSAASVALTTHKQDEEDEKVVKDFIQQNDDEDHVSEFSVYYDQDKGLWKCQICSWDSQGRTSCLAHHNLHPRWHSQANAKTIYETKGIPKSHVSENTDITNNTQENGNGTHSVIRKSNREPKRDEMPFEGDQVVTSYINSETEIGDIEQVKDNDNEITEYDVEKVIREQDTHELFCPNCNSCITKRVILRKRKRQVPVSGEDAKRGKPQTPVSSEPNVVLENASDNHALNGVDSRLDDHQREPDVFRCLSCFSIFMPTGNGFKLFRMFGNKSNAEENNEHAQKEVPVKKSWFSNSLRSEKVEHNGADLNVGGRVSSNLNSSMQEANSYASDGTTGKMETDSTLADTQEQLLTSYNIETESNSTSEYPGMFVVKPPLTNDVEPAENSISPLQHDGLKLVVPPNVGSLIIDNSQMNQELDITVQTMNPAVNDTIITIEGKQLDASVFQTPPESLVPMGTTSALQQAVEHGVVRTTTTGSGRSLDLDIIKCIVYGGLIELITSLSVVSSAAGADAATLNVLALGLANIFGGLLVISHDLWNLKIERARKTEDRYQQLLGQRADFSVHMAVSLLSYLVFGFLPPIVYGFSFHESNDKDLKLLMVAAASVVCIMILAAGKAHVQSPRESYFKTISYHVMLGFMVSGVSYLFGGLIMMLLEKMDVFLNNGSVENLRVRGASSNPVIATF